MQKPDATFCRFTPLLRCAVWLAAGLALGGGLPVAGRADGPPSDPMLRIETGMHIAQIYRIATDAAGRYLVTASFDKTARVWERATGRLLQTLRPPIGKAKEGMVYAVALSPDGSTVACGGWMTEGESWAICLFDRASGQMIRRITGLPGRVFRLAYSRDGRFLAAALRSKGLQIYRAPDYTLAARDSEYGDRSEGLDFDARGRLVTACHDGYIRLYDANFKRIARAKAPGGPRPWTVRFSPGGTKVAVGYGNTTRVSVLSAADLSPLYQPDTAGVDDDLRAVAWSADGQTLYAAGRWGKNGTPIRKWSREGRGPYTDLASGADNTIYDFVPLPDGEIAFCSADPDFGVFDREGRRYLLLQTAIADYREFQQGFLLSADASAVRFAYQRAGKIPAVFSLPRRLLELQTDGQASGNAGLQPPRVTVDGLQVTDWKNNEHPQLNGKPLPLERLEDSRSLAIAPDNRSFLLGTEWYVRCFGRDGKERWSAPVPGIAWSVNVSADGKVGAAALGDGTIRWYRMSDGRELLALFPHADHTRWIAWTPSGYYDCSPGGEDLIGWHLNRGKDHAADFFAASRFRSTYYRPDVVSRVLTTLDETEALRLANDEAGIKAQTVTVQQSLPPVVRILAPEDNTELAANPVTLRYSLRAPSGEPITGLKVLVDGRPLMSQRGVREAPDPGAEPLTREVTLTLPERDCTLSVLAENRFAASEPASIRLRWRAPSRPAAFVIKPKLYLLSIGVSQYQDPELRLNFPAKDAREFAEAMQRQKGQLYEDVSARILTDSDAKREAILDGLEWLQKETTSKDVAIVFLSGHGTEDINRDYYFLPVGYVQNKSRTTGVPFYEITKTIGAIAGKVLFFVDTCHAGHATGRRSKGDIVGVVNELSSAENGAVVFAASTGREEALEDDNWGNGAFTKSLLEALSGKADAQRTGRITVNMLNLYISERVKQLTEGRQHPTTTVPPSVPDFPVAVD